MNERSIFAAALDIADAAERAMYLDRACGNDAALRRQIDELLAAEAKLGSFLNKPPAEPTVGYEPIAERVGTTIGPYKLMEQIGEGGMGLVFVAEQEKPVRRKVALKIIKPGMGSRDVIARFEAERQALALMDHPNIARVLDAGTTQSGLPYFVMELVKGIPIIEYCDLQRLTSRERLDLFLAVCQAVQHAHSKGIIHRDLKPSNILVAPHDGVPVVKVIDFGVAKAIGQQLTDKTIYTRLTQMIGTPLYMSPEQAEINALDVDIRSDVYSLGVLLYELLTGSTPFDRQRFAAAAYDEIRRIIKEEEPPKPSTRLSSLGATLTNVSQQRRTEPAKLSALVKGDLDWIVMKALEKDRNRRYETASAFAADVRRFLANEPIEARPPSAAYRLRKFVKRNQGAVTAASVVLMAVILGIIGTTWGWVDAIQARKDEAEQRKTAVKAISDARDAEAAKATAEADARIRLENEQGKTKEALALAITNERLAEKRREEADFRREQAEALAVRVELEHYLAMAEERPHVALVGAATLLPKAARLKDQSLADLFRMQVGAFSRRAADLTSIIPHGSLLRAVALSADGKTALTGTSSGDAQLWETATGKPIGQPWRHKNSLRSVALSADAKTALTGGSGNTAQLWETATGKPIGPPMQHQNFVTAAALSADGKTALTGSQDNTARLWDAATGKPIGPPLQHQNFVVAVALSADGKTALTGSWDKTAQLWDTATGKPIGPRLQHEAVVAAVALSADGKTALTASGGNTVSLWETATAKRIGLPLKFQAMVAAVALSTDGRTFLTASFDKTARLWETATGRPIGQPLQHRDAVVAVAISADNKTVLTGSWDKMARVWEQTAPKPAVPPLEHLDGVSAVALSADGKTALTGSRDNTARLWQTATGKQIGPHLQHKLFVMAVALSADGKTALTGSRDTKAQLWETATAKPIGPPLQPQHRGGGVVVALSANGKTALTGSRDRTARLWDTASGKPIGEALKHQDAILAVALSADGKTALTGCEDNTAWLWETATGKKFGLPLQHRDKVNAVALSADGKTVLTGSADETARLWETATGKSIGPPLQHQAGVLAVALSADGKIALTGCDDKTARLWNTVTGKQIGPPLRHQDKVVAVALSADGKTALTGSDDKTARLWNVPQPMPGDPERIMLWAQVITGLEVDDLTAVRVLDAATWQQRRDRLQKLGGPPAQ